MSETSKRGKGKAASITCHIANHSEECTHTLTHIHIHTHAHACPQVKQYETALREMSQGGQGSGEKRRTAEALEKLITVSEQSPRAGKNKIQSGL